MNYHRFARIRNTISLINRFRLILVFASSLGALGFALGLVQIVEAWDCGFRCYAKAWQPNVSLVRIEATWDVQTLEARDPTSSDPFILSDL